MTYFTNNYYHQMNRNYLRIKRKEILSVKGKRTGQKVDRPVDFAFL